MKRRQGQRVDNPFALETLIRDLYALGLSMSEIALLFKRCISNAYDAWSAATIAVFIKRFGGAKAFRNRPKKRDVFAAVLTRYAEIVTLQYDAGVIERNDVPGAHLRVVLAAWLRVDEILAMLRGVLTTMDRLLVPQVPQGREGYVRLLGEVFNTPLEHRGVHEAWLVMFDDEQRSVWRDYLAGIAAGKQTLPTSREELECALMNLVLAQHRSAIMPIWDDTVFVETDRVIATLTEREQGVICARFGLRGTQKKTLRELGDDWEVSLERIRDIQEKAMERLRHRLYTAPLRAYVTPLQDALATITEQRAVLEQQTSFMRALPMGVAMLDVLLQPVECLEISVRAANVLASMHARRLGDVVQFTESDVLRTKNAGRKTLKEIRTALLESFGLWLGMTWSSDLKRAYDEAKQRGESAMPPPTV